ncbi:MAG: sigma-70 family RNA polymerase sigma factor [Caldilineaceae bacterium]
MMHSDQAIPTTTLVKRCLAGDANAWQQLVNRYARLVHSIPVRHGLTPDEVNDVGQEVFLALAQYLHQIEDPEKLPSWLITTARRFSWRTLQKRRNEYTGEQSDIGEEQAFTPTHEPQAQPIFSKMPSMNELLEGWNRQELLAQAMAQLQDRCRRLLSMLFLDTSEPSYEEISNQTGLPKGSIGPTRIRCLQQLRTILEELGFDEEL